jgi:MFS family permease
MLDICPDVRMVWRPDARRPTISQFRAAMGWAAYFHHWRLAAYHRLPIYIYERTGSTLAISLATIAGTVPHVVFGSFAGALVDHWNYKRAMILADILRACMLPLLLFAGSDGMVWLIYVVAAMLATCSVVFGPARTALIPRLVEKERLLAANALDSFSDTIAGLLGPALGGLLLGLIYLTGVVILDAASFLISGLLIAYVAIPARSVDRATEPKSNQAHSMMPGANADFWQTWLLDLGQIRHNSTIFMLFVVYGAAMLGQGIINVLWVVFVKKILAGDAVVYGGIQTAVALGTLIGGALIGTFGRKISLRYLDVSA